MAEPLRDALPKGEGEDGGDLQRLRSDSSRGLFYQRNEYHQGCFSERQQVSRFAPVKVNESIEKLYEEILNG